MSRLCQIALLWVAALAALGTAAAEPKAPAAGEERIETLDQLTKKIEQIRKETGTPAVGFALVENGRPQWVGSFGEANLERHVKADADTMYRIGSVSKMFVGLAVLKLVEEGRLHLDDKVRDLAPDIAFENRWEASHPVRLVHLLEHTTGWDDMHFPEYGYAAPDNLSLKQGLAYHPDSRVSRWMPGTRMAYCNTGPVVAAYIVEKITGARFEDYVQQQFFTPLGMRSATYFESDVYQRRGATLYSGGKAEPYWHFYGRPSGSVNASPADMAKFVQMMIARGSFGGRQLVQSVSIDRMEVPASSLGAASGITSGYGLHNYVTGYKHYRVAFHGHNGGLPGALTDLSYSSTLGSGYIVMINTSGPALQKISDAAKSYLLRNTPQPKAPASVLPARFQGLDGYFRPINTRQQSLAMVEHLFGTMKISAHGNVLRREPLLGGWDAPSADYAVGANLLANPWTGLPSIAFVNDPLAGESLAIETGLFKQVSPVTVFGQLGLLALVGLFGAGNLLFALVWLPRRLRGKLGGGSTIQVRTTPLLATLALVAALGLPWATSAGVADFGRVSVTSVGIFVASLAYPLFALAGAVTLYRACRDAINRWAFWSSAALTGFHLLFCILLASYGMIGHRSWV